MPRQPTKTPPRPDELQFAKNSADRVALPESVGKPADPAASPGAAATGIAPGANAAAAPTSRRSYTPRRKPDANRVKNDKQPNDELPIPDSMKETITAGEYIQALHDAGVYTGIGAFNPPGTSPPLEGLAVPEDFPLPEGYVRHFQTTDDGVAIEPILMYSPDFEFLDANGNPVPIPADRVVPPEHAPPGFPIRPIEMPPKREPGDLSR